MLLPKVEKDIFASVGQSMEEDNDSDAEFIMKYSKHLEKVNPVILTFISDWSEKSKGKSFLRLVIGMLTVYRLLESQAEAEQMNRDFGGECEEKD